MAKKLAVDLSTSKIVYINGYKTGRIMSLAISFSLEGDLRTLVNTKIIDKAGEVIEKAFPIRFASLRIEDVEGKYGIQKVSFDTLDKNDFKEFRVK
jgi:hypothetical protein